jgi:uncharacterized protein (DUF4415 family)
MAKVGFSLDRQKGSHLILFRADPPTTLSVPVPPGKTRITIRLDDDLIQWFKDQVHAAGGGNYQTLINVALREYMEGKREPLGKL